VILDIKVKDEHYVIVTHQDDQGKIWKSFVSRRPTIIRTTEDATEIALSGEQADDELVPANREMMA
jgi:hypothetical protein